jgi:eukaryotic-like serine/threonine-protein kinase
MSVPNLTVIAGPDANKVLVLHPGVGMLGRHQESTYRLNDVRVSRHHCEIVVDDQGDVIVRDNGSSAGTRINGNVVQGEAPLKPGDILQVGETMLKYGGGTGQTATLTSKDGPVRPAAEYDPLETAELSSLTGRTLVRYQIIEPIGTGSNSMVFKAISTEDGRTIALKVMTPSFTKDEEEVERFIRAMRTMSPVSHPNIVKLHTAGKSGPYCWVAMELVDGESLTGVIKRIGAAGMLDWKYAFRVALHIGRALSYAHEMGVIHRDICPANILVENGTKFVKLGDLMLAKGLEGHLAKQITRPGEFVGDPNYMSPERVAGTGLPVDGRSDLFSLGATCYALLTGKPPFAGNNLIETLMKIRAAEPLKPSTFQMGIPGPFETVVMKLLEKQPENRYQTADSLVIELERIGNFNGIPLI